MKHWFLINCLLFNWKVWPMEFEVQNIQIHQTLKSTPFLKVSVTFHKNWVMQHIFQTFILLCTLVIRLHRDTAMKAIIKNQLREQNIKVFIHTMYFVSYPKRNLYLRRYLPTLFYNEYSILVRQITCEQCQVLFDFSTAESRCHFHHDFISRSELFLWRYDVIVGHFGKHFGRIGAKTFWGEFFMHLFNDVFIEDLSESMFWIS